MFPADELKTVFTQYWQFMALVGACRLHIFDAISQQPGISISELASVLHLHEPYLRTLLIALADYDILQIGEKDHCHLKVKGQLLTDAHPQSLKNACLLWGEEQLEAWRELPDAMRMGKPSFELVFGEGFFEYLSTRPDKLKNYQLAMSEYARSDYADLPGKIDFKVHPKVADVGGGYGTAVKLLAASCPENKFIVFDRPEVVAGREEAILPNVQFVGGDFFRPMPFSSDAILLARVLHDWPDEECIKILINCHRSLSDDGRLYIIEILKDMRPTPILDLHMCLICGSRERNHVEYVKLLRHAGFELIGTKSLNRLQSIIVAKKI